VLASAAIEFNEGMSLDATPFFCSYMLMAWHDYIQLCKAQRVENLDHSNITVQIARTCNQLMTVTTGTKSNLINKQVSQLANFAMPLMVQLCFYTRLKATM